MVGKGTILLIIGQEERCVAIMQGRSVSRYAFERQ